MTYLLVLMTCLGMKGRRTLNTAKAASGSGSDEADQAWTTSQMAGCWAVAIDDRYRAVSYGNSVVDEALVHRLAQGQSLIK